MPLHSVRHGPARGGRTPVVIAHGLFGSARNWNAIARQLAADRPVIVPDLRNHGESPWDDRHDYPALAADLAALIEAESMGPLDMVGHSMGGKAAMTLALARPDLVRRLVVLDIAPVAYGHAADRLREIAAMRAVDPATVATRSEAAEKLGLSDPAVAAFLLGSLDLKARRWRLHLDALGNWMDAITGWHDPAGRFEGPTLFLAGEDSPYIRPEHRERIRALFPQARLARLRGAGHWLQADRPRETEAALRAFLDAQGPRG
ncbi:alpha/beta fold hydrolase [Rubellimicrobium sp. CFH 75288]|uniref:alpha/beta fold hydrolase n=1 Tax=Rubellimicrobium sp. CFH 75288 TaxID=2697034 RepID=UPI001411BF79|nr:alpha/beta fold hydrolase [Rubellimicrobium sp. CFH 75288]